MSIKLVEVLRGEQVESVHTGSIVVADSRGRILYKAGNPERYTYFRSSGKPLQAIAALETGIVEHFGLELGEVAIIASSHNGEKQHVQVLRSMMEKAGISEEALQCGIHEPHDREAAKELYLEGKLPTVLHCNCSGKHLGILLACMLKGYDTKSYLDPQHPFQREILSIISEFTAVKPEDIRRGVDGCGLPVYAVPLQNMATAYARLCDPDFREGKYGKSQNYLISAMTMFPEMVAGKGRLDTDMMRNFGDRMISKSGSEAVYCAGLIGKGIGISIKIEDGNSRAVGPLIVELLLSMGIIHEEEAQKVVGHWKPVIKNHKGERVGSVKSCFQPGKIESRIFS